MAVYVTDTHPLLWYSTETYRKLSLPVRRIFEKASRGDALIWIPAMVIWEAGLLERIGRIRFKPSFPEWAEALLSHPGFGFAPVDLDSVLYSLEIRPNSDLFDTAIVAVARQKNVPLITKDQLLISDEAVETIW